MDNALKHYGILGMKWGIRRSPEELGHPRGMRKKEKSTSSDYDKAHSKKPVSQMSNKELQDRLSRLRMEREYQSFNPSKLKRAYQAVGTAIAVVGTYKAAKKILNEAGFDIDKVKQAVSTASIMAQGIPATIRQYRG